MFTIGQLANLANVGIETIRFYQRQRLLEVPAFAGKVRYYGDEHLRRLRFIKKAQVAGFALKEIKVLLALDATHDRKQVRELAEERLEALEQKIEELVTARDALKRLARACANSARGPCPILASFEV